MSSEIARRKRRRCSECGAEIIALLSVAGEANPDICLTCSGATLEDFLDADMSDEDYGDEQTELLRMFHGKD